MLQMSEERFSTFWESFSQVMAFIFAIILIGAPIYSLVLGVLYNGAVLDEDKEKAKRYGKLF